jgi:hypothetical protein
LDASSLIGIRDHHHHLATLEQDLRPILNHTLCHAALISNPKAMNIKAIPVLYLTKTLIYSQTVLILGGDTASS